MNRIRKGEMTSIVHNNKRNANKIKSDQMVYFLHDTKIFAAAYWERLCISNKEDLQNKLKSIGLTKNDPLWHDINEDPTNKWNNNIWLWQYRQIVPFQPVYHYKGKIARKNALYNKICVDDNMIKQLHEIYQNSLHYAKQQIDKPLTTNNKNSGGFVDLCSPEAPKSKTSSRIKHTTPSTSTALNVNTTTSTSTVDATSLFNLNTTSISTIDATSSNTELNLNTSSILNVNTSPLKNPHQQNDNDSSWLHNEHCISQISNLFHLIDKNKSNDNNNNININKNYNNISLSMLRNLIDKKKYNNIDNNININNNKNNININANDNNNNININANNNNNNININENNNNNNININENNNNNNSLTDTEDEDGDTNINTTNNVDDTHDKSEQNESDNDIISNLNNQQNTNTMQWLQQNSKLNVEDNNLNIMNMQPQFTNLNDNLNKINIKPSNNNLNMESTIISASNANVNTINIEPLNNNDDNKDELSWKCKHCDTINPNINKFCPQCGRSKQYTPNQGLSLWKSIRMRTKMLNNNINPKDKRNIQQFKELVSDLKQLNNFQYTDAPTVAINTIKMILIHYFPFLNESVLNHIIFTLTNMITNEYKQFWYQNEAMTRTKDSSLVCNKQEWINFLEIYMNSIYTSQLRIQK